MTKRGGISLSKEQAAIVDHVKATSYLNPTVASAGAGTGKTRTMSAAALDLILTRQDVKIDDFALITFTNKATDEMRERLEEELDNRINEAKDSAEAEKWFEQKERMSGGFIGTIHRFCSMILRQHGYDEYVPHETEMMVAKGYFLEALKEALNWGLTNPQTRILFNYSQIPWATFEWEQFLSNLYEHIRNNGRTIEHVVERTLRQPEDNGTPYRVAVALMLQKMNENYHRIKQERGAQDSHDLLQKCAALMTKHQERIGKVMQQRYKFLFVDEFQDTDRTQLQIIRHLIPYMDHVLVVGDRKQAIYGWRGSVDSVLMELAEEYGMEPLPLLSSRRPTRRLFKTQEVLFSTMGGRYPLLQESLSVPEDAHEPNDDIIPLEYIHIRDRDREAYIQKAIEKVREYRSQVIHRPDEERRQIEFSDICFLFRTNRQMSEYKEQFEAAGIPVVTDVGGGFFQRPEIVYCYRMINAILSYPNDTTLDLIMGTPFFPVIAPITIHRTVESSTQLSSWVKSNPSVKRWYDGMMKIRQDIKLDLVPQLLTKIYEFTGVREYYAQRGDIKAIANLEKLVSWSRDMFDNAEALTMHSFFERLQRSILSAEKMDEADTDEEKPNAVVFSTVHSSKGLEYPIVMIPNLERPLLTDFKIPKFFDIATPEDWGIDLNIDGYGISVRFNEWMENYKKAFFQEEARVFYVAVTRAQHAVCFLGGGKSQPVPVHSEKWSWKDEVLLGLKPLESLGNQFVRIQM